jgi:hypothetical protein
MLHMLANGDVHRGDLAGVRCPDGVEHFHRFQHTEFLSGCDMLARLRCDRDDNAGEWGTEDAGVGLVLSRRHRKSAFGGRGG